ncbi:thioesterase II family protein [Parvimonas micra]|uniref:thioesterase II family protein n=1 Tax=Parvimonas micra TaxID=33033 RepID=UPI00241EAA08|nr:thioesterase domain-containing protein [Parvimonas micra]
MKNIKLFCFPHLGGSASIYYQWKKIIHKNIEIVPIELAGRGERNKEQLYKDFKELLSDVCIQVTDNNLENYAFFGHSMGALIAYETVYNLLNQGFPPPIHIFFSGSNPPNHKSSLFFKQLNEHDLVSELKKIGGIPDVIFEYPELIEVILPIIQADYKVMNTYKFVLQTPKMKNDITIILGDCDSTIIYEKIAKWRLLTTGKSSVHFMKGKHFYIDNSLKDLLKLIELKLLK